MGCKQSTAKEQAPLPPVTVAVNAPQPVVEVAEIAPVQVLTQETMEEAKAITSSTPPVSPQKPVENELIEESKEEKETTVPTPAVGKDVAVVPETDEVAAAPTKKKNKKTNRVPVKSQHVAPAAAVRHQQANDENAFVSPKKTGTTVSRTALTTTTPKRVAFAPVQQENTAAARGHKKGQKHHNNHHHLRAPNPTKAAKIGKQPNMNEDLFKQMTMAFQRELTHAHHLEAQLATR